jgi:hypothetical protein
MLTSHLQYLPQLVVTNDTNSVLVYKSSLASSIELISGCTPFDLKFLQTVRVVDSQSPLELLTRPTSLRMFKISAHFNTQPLSIEAMPVSLSSRSLPLTPLRGLSIVFKQQQSLDSYRQDS